jgi:hypothetical protein
MNLANNTQEYIMPKPLESIAISILEGDTVETTLSNNEALELIEHLQAWLPNYPKGSNKFITFLQQNVSPIHAVYGVYSAVDNGSLELTSKNFQAMILFEAEFKDLIKHLENPDKKTNFFESMKLRTDISKVELDLTSPFCIQPEDEIGTGTYDQQVSIEELFTDPDDDATVAPQTTAPTVQTTTKSTQSPLRDILDKAAKKVFGVGVKKTAADDEDRDAYHVYTHYYFTPIISATPKFEVVSAKYWDEKEELDDQPISEYLEHIILDWGTHWHEREPSIIEYTGPGTLEDATELLRETGFFKPCKLHDDTPADLILSMLDEAPAEVVLDILKLALDKLSPEDVTEIASELTNILQE